MCSNFSKDLQFLFKLS